MWFAGALGGDRVTGKDGVNRTFWNLELCFRAFKA